jgi:hypothetical protein
LSLTQCAMGHHQIYGRPAEFQALVQNFTQMTGSG